MIMQLIMGIVLIIAGATIFYISRKYIRASCKTRLVSQEAFKEKSISLKAIEIDFSFDTSKVALAKLSKFCKSL